MSYEVSDEPVDAATVQSPDYFTLKQPDAKTNESLDVMDVVTSEIRIVSVSTSKLLRFMQNKNKHLFKNRF